MGLYQILDKKDSQSIILIQYCHCIFSIIIYIINSINYSSFSYTFLSYYLIFSYLYIVFINIRTAPLMSAFNLFLFGYFMFQVSAVFVSLDTIRERQFMQIHFSFSIQQINNTLSANILILHSMFLGCLMSRFGKYDNISLSPLKSNYKLEDWGSLVFWIFLPLTLIKFILEIKLVLAEGYYAYYTSSLSLPLFISISRFFFELGFFLTLASLPSKKKFLFISKVYLLVMCLFFLVGVRNRVILSFLFVIWFYYKFYTNKNPRVFLLVVLTICSVVLLLLVQFLRQNGVFFSGDRSLLNYFFYSQSINFYILPLLQNLNIHSDVPYIFGPILNFDTAQYNPHGTSNLLGNAIAYHISQKAFADGHGLGSSFIAELYELGMIVMLTGSFILGFIIDWFEKRVAYNRSWLVISFYIITNCIYISRSSLFRNIYMIILILVLAFILMNIKYPLKDRNNEYNSCIRH